MIYYCNECRNFFHGENVKTDEYCSLIQCRGQNLRELNDELYYIVDRLNNNGYIVSDILIRTNRICIVFDDICLFKSLPDGFEIHHDADEHWDYFIDDIIQGEPYTEIYYMDKDTGYNYRKSKNELRDIVKDLTKWVNVVCRPAF